MADNWSVLLATLILSVLLFLLLCNVSSLMKCCPVTLLLLDKLRRPGHMVWNKLCWDANNAVGVSKQKKNQTELVRVPLFWKSHCIISVPAWFIPQRTYSALWKGKKINSTKKIKTKTWQYRSVVEDITGSKDSRKRMKKDYGPCYRSDDDSLLTTLKWEWGEGKLSLAERLEES